MRMSDASSPFEGSGPAVLRGAAGMVALTLAASLAACGGGEGSDGAAADGGPRVFFEQPRDGADVTSPVRVVFGSENIQVAAVPDTVDEPRPGTIHYHLGLDTDCLEPGTRIPSADPWIHFGDGSNEIEMQLAPGEHTLTVQAGDDEHVTREGLCQTISVTVAEEG